MTNALSLLARQFASASFIITNRVLARKAKSQSAALGPTGELANEQIVDEVFAYIMNDVYELCESVITDSSALVIQKSNAQHFKKLKKLERERKILEDFVGCSLDAFFQWAEESKKVFWEMKTIGLSKLGRKCGS